jgi:predicted DNA binding CopG/RHH family protein
LKRAATLKPLPDLTSDEAAEAFVGNADLTTFDLSGFQPMQFELKAKSANVSMRMPQDLLTALKAKAAREGIPYQRFIRHAIEKALNQRS